MSKPDSDSPAVPWRLRRDVRIGGGIVATVATLLASALAALERMGVFH